MLLKKFKIETSSQNGYIYKKICDIDKFVNKY